MKLRVLGSSSSGNCYILENEKECLILEAGVDFKEVLKALDYKLEKVVGCLVTHEHLDHARYVKSFLDNGISIYTSQGTCEKIGVKSTFLKAIKSNDSFIIGNFKVIAFDVKHDAQEPYGYYINHYETGNILFATDTCYIPNKFKALNNILIECNYSYALIEEKTRNGIISSSLKNRIVQSHMAFETCKSCLEANDTRQVNNVILVHLSDNNSDEKMFQKEIKQLLPYANVYVADKGLDIEFNKYRF